MTQNNRAEWRALRSVQGEGKYLRCLKAAAADLKGKRRLERRSFFHRFSGVTHNCDSNTPNVSNKGKVHELMGHLDNCSDLHILPDSQLALTKRDVEGSLFSLVGLSAVLRHSISEMPNRTKRPAATSQFCDR